MRTALLAIVLGAILAMAAGGATYLWLKYNDVALSAHGTVALVLGVVVSLALGIGLMRLVYMSGRDERDESFRDPPAQG